VETGAALATIGLACIIEVLVPIASLGHQGFLPIKVARRYLTSRGYETIEPLDQDGASMCPLPATNIRKIIPSVA
jgi:hypothetical protein